jgi:hypothetical protein
VTIADDYTIEAGWLLEDEPDPCDALINQLRVAEGPFLTTRKGTVDSYSGFDSFGKERPVGVVDFSSLKPVFTTDDGVQIFGFSDKRYDAEGNFVPDFYNEKEEDYARIIYNVYVKDHVVTIKQQEHVSGVAESGKKWQRWKNLSIRSYSLKTEKFGKSLLRVYDIAGTRKAAAHRPKIENVTATAVLTRPQIASSYRAHLNTGQMEQLSRIALFDGRVFDTTDTRTTANLFAWWMVLKKYSEANPDVDLQSLAVSRLVHRMAYPVMELFAEKGFIGEGLYEAPRPLYYAPRHYDEGRMLRTGSHLLFCEPNLRAFTQKLVGKRNVRKDLMKAVAESEFFAPLELIHRLRNAVPTDWLIMLVKDPKKYVITTALIERTYDPEEYSFKYITDLLAKTTETNRKRLLLAVFTNNREDMHFRDTLRMLHTFAEEKHDIDEQMENLSFRSWKELHDSLSRALQFIKNKPKPFEQDGLMGELDGFEYTFEGKQYKIVSPKWSSELFDWGNQMSNCIGGYTSSVLAGHTTVFAVYEDGEMLANMEVSREGYMRQLYKKFNQYVDAPLYEETEKHVKAAVKRVEEARKAEEKAKEAEKQKQQEKEKKAEAARKKRRAQPQAA